MQKPKKEITDYVNLIFNDSFIFSLWAGGAQLHYARKLEENYENIISCSTVTIVLTIIYIFCFISSIFSKKYVKQLKIIKCILDFLIGVMSVATVYILEFTHKQALNVLAEAYKQLVQAQSNNTRF